MATRTSAKALDDVSESLTVPYRLSSAEIARHALVRSMAGAPVRDEVVSEAEVVVSELVTNSVQHVTPFSVDAVIRVVWTLRKGVIEIAVTDAGGESTPQPVRRHPLADNGRGLRIVRSLAHEWGVLDANPGVTVWASIGGPSRRRTR